MYGFFIAIRVPRVLTWKHAGFRPGCRIGRALPVRRKNATGRQSTNSRQQDFAAPAAGIFLFCINLPERSYAFIAFFASLPGKLARACGRDEMSGIRQSEHHAIGSRRTTYFRGISQCSRRQSADRPYSEHSLYLLSLHSLACSPASAFWISGKSRPICAIRPTACDSPFKRASSAHIIAFGSSRRQPSPV